MTSCLSCSARGVGRKALLKSVGKSAFRAKMADGREVILSDEGQGQGLQIESPVVVKPTVPSRPSPSPAPSPAPSSAPALNYEARQPPVAQPIASPSSQSMPGGWSTSKGKEKRA